MGFFSLNEGRIIKITVCRNVTAFWKKEQATIISMKVMLKLLGLPLACYVSLVVYVIFNSISAKNLLHYDADLLSRFKRTESYCHHSTPLSLSRDSRFSFYEFCFTVYVAVWISTLGDAPSPLVIPVLCGNSMFD